MMKAMLSQPMAGKSEEEIKVTREKAGMAKTSILSWQPTLDIWIQTGKLLIQIMPISETELSRL